MASKEALRQGGGGEQRHDSPNTDRRMEDMAAAMKAVCDAAKADKARQEWLEAELAGQTSRANASELEKAALQDRVQQLEAALEEQGTKAAVAWRHQQEVARLQEKLGRRSVELLAKEQELSKMRAQLKEAASEVAALTLHLKETKEKLLETEAALAGSREAHKQDVSELQSRLSKAQEEITEVETAYEELRQQATAEILELRGRLTQMSEKLCDLGGRLNDTNDKLVVTLAARTATRDKYNTLAEQLLLLSRSAAAAVSSAGGAPAAATGAASAADAQGHIDRCLPGWQAASSTLQGEPTAAAAATAARTTGVSVSPANGKANALLTAPVRSLQSSNGAKSGRSESDSPGVSVMLSAASDNDSSNSRAPAYADCKSALGVAGLSVNTAQGSSKTGRTSVSSSPSRRSSGMFSRFRSSNLAAAVAQSFGAILSPRSDSRRASTDKLLQQGRPAADLSEELLTSSGSRTYPRGSAFENSITGLSLSDGSYLIKAGHQGHSGWRCHSTNAATTDRTTGSALSPFSYAHEPAGRDCSSVTRGMASHSLNSSSTAAAAFAAMTGSGLDGAFQLFDRAATQQQQRLGCAFESAKHAEAAGSSSALTTGEDRFTDCSADDPADVNIMSHYVSVFGDEHSE